MSNLNNWPAEKFFDYDVYSGNLEELKNGKNILINTINQYSYCIAEKDSTFKKSLKGGDVLLPDGVAVVASTKLLTGRKIKKIAGADLHQMLLEHLNKTGGSCFYLGASVSTLQKIYSRLAKDFPNIKVGYHSPPFKPEFTDQESLEMIRLVNEFKPNVLFVGMTAPKQEKWAFQYKHDLQADIICTIGAVFDFYAGTVERPSQIWIDSGLEWFVRLMKEPKRLWKRYLYYGPVFLTHLAKARLRPSR